MRNLKRGARRSKSPEISEAESVHDGSPGLRRSLRERILRAAGLGSEKRVN